jgi:biotin operon repressor
MGRVYGWLLICDPPQQSLTQLADALSVSKASVSTVARQLQEAGMVERLPSPNRQHLYRVDQRDDNRPHEKCRIRSGRLPTVRAISAHRSRRVQALGIGPPAAR